MVGMRRFGRRAAIGATTLALVLAAAGTSLASVRSSRYGDGITPSGIALRAPSVSRSSPQPTLPPTSSSDTPDVFVPDAEVLPSVTPGGVIQAPAAQPPAGSPTINGSAPPAGPDAVPAVPAVTPVVGALSARPAARPTVTTLPPASGPTPTTAPVRTASACPSHAGKGALPVRGGPLQAVDFALRWPVAGPLVLVPQASAVRNHGAAVKIASTNVQMAADGTSLSLSVPLTVGYTLQSGRETARGAIRFTSVSGPSVNLTRQACRNSMLALYDVNKAVLNGSAVRIVGMVAPTSTIYISAEGGTAFFVSNQPGTHKVTLLTANDAGAAADVITLSVNVA